MLDRRLDQSFIVDPHVSFKQISQILYDIGWQLHINGSSSKPLIIDEPEAASWTWQGQKPIIIYTFNPVVKLRVLDVSTLPPVFRAKVFNKIPILSNSDIDNLFFSHEPRERLLALWATQASERVDLLIQVERLTKDDDEVVKSNAVLALEKLKRVSEARLETFSQLQILVQAAPDLIRQLEDPALVLQLKPTIEDCKKLFDENLAGSAFESAKQWYGEKSNTKNLKLNKIDSDAVIEVTAIPAGLLRWSNEISEKFPSAFRDIAGWMMPNRIWLTWKITHPKASTVRYDGLTWLDDHWVWLPKVYRELSPLCLNGRLNSSQVQIH